MQLWFAGVHSDVGGSYPENEARLSDVALGWMAGEATRIDGPLLLDPSVLRTWPDAGGMQHDERRSGWLPYRRRVRAIPADAPLHPSVLARLELPAVLRWDLTGPYRPEALRGHAVAKGCVGDERGKET